MTAKIAYLADQEQPQSLDELAEKAIQLGHDIVSVSGFVDEMDQNSQTQVALIERARHAADDVSHANADVRAAADEMVQAVAATMETVNRSSDRIRSNSAQSQKVAEWVQTLDERMLSVSGTLKTMQSSTLQIGEIALQVNILAINAKIEAARAGEAGRGFSVVAEEINNLSRKTAQATDSIRAAIEGLTAAVGSLRNEAEDVAALAADAITESSGIDEALKDMTSHVLEGQNAAEEIARKAKQVKAANDSFAPVFTEVMTGASESAKQLHAARKQVTGLIETSESMVQISVEMGAATADTPMIELVRNSANQLGAALESAVADGRISMSQLFDQRYRPIPGSNPEQVLAPYTEITDRLFPAIQEPILKIDPRIVFCAAVDRNGYLPTHNRKFSAPQGDDPVWNAANSRNRRMFNDRVGLGAGRNTHPFLMQIYRRDMGGGNFVMMKDLSAPIMVQGRHWGGLRLAYKF